MQPSDARRRRFPLYAQILLGLVAGIVIGAIANASMRGPDGAPSDQLLWYARNVAKPIGSVFLRLIFMVVIPLIVSALILGIVELGDVRRVGRLGLRTLALTVVFSSISVVLALLVANVIRPGETLSAEQRAALQAPYQQAASARVQQSENTKSIGDALLSIIPENPLAEAVGALDGTARGGGMLAVMFFAVALGIAITSNPQRCGPLIGVFEGLFDASMAIIGFAMRIAPFAVAALGFALTAELGIGIFATLGAYVGSVLGVLLVHAVVVYGAALVLIARRSPVAFFKACRDAIVTAFATSSSTATLPTALRVAQQEAGIRPRTANFVLTVGATANQNGTALYEGITVLFLAQLFGVPLTWVEQIQVALLCILAGIGTAGVPGGSLPFIVMVLQMVHVPAESIAVILGVDRLLDMSRTVVNVAGDLTIAACVDEPEPTS